MRPQRVVVVGASLAGATTALSLRRLGFTGNIVLVGEEPHLPYERPGLSKQYLAGDMGRDQLLIQPESEYRRLDIELQLGAAATAVDTDGRTVQMTGGSSVGYDTLVVATGSTNLAPPIPGLGLRGVHQLRSIDDADRLSSSLAGASTAVVVGMGFIGCEVAATLRGRGLDVTMVDRLAGPLTAQLGPVLSAHVRAWHEAHGVHLVPGADVAAFRGDDVVESVALADGRLFPADVVVVGVGVRPATAWLTAAPVHLTRGAVGVDGLGRTSAPDVYAAGDAAAVWSPSSREHRRTEHYRAATDQGTRVAHAILGLPVPAALPSWFWSDQYDHVLHYAGERDGTELHVRQSPYTCFFTRGSTLRAVAAIDNGRDFRRALRLLDSDIDLRGLSGPDGDLRRLTPADLPLPAPAASRPPSVPATSQRSA